MLIRDLEGKTGLDRATIRFYEREGLIVPERKDNGYREYTDEHLSHLLKIKLLRLLGMSLGTIKGLQQGTEDFDAALTACIQALEQQIKEANKAKEVCAVLRSANVRYDTLDAKYYLDLFSKEETNKPERAFHEYVSRPCHPFRRFFARMTDYVLLQLILELLVIVIFRVRPYRQFLSLIIAYGTPFLSVLLSAIMLRYWGTTPGKWLFGLSVRSENGDLLDFEAAFTRECGALRYGYGFGLPIYRVVRLIISCVVYNREDPVWDQYCEYQYRVQSGKKKMLVMLAVVMIGALSIFVASDLTKPKHRGEVTIEQFAENYNYYYYLTSNKKPNYYDELQPDGTWLELPNDVVVIDAFATPVNPRQEFVFETTDSYVDSIIYKNTWTEVTHLSPINSKCHLAAVSALMTQKGIGFWDLYRFSKIMDETDFGTDGTLIYKNIEIIWDVTSKNCVYYDGAFYNKSVAEGVGNANNSLVSIVLKINILPK